LKKLPPLPVDDRLKRSDLLYQWYRDLIEHWDLNTPLPSQNMVMQQVGVSLATITTTLKRLEGEGLVRRYRGKGTFIQQRDITKFSGEKPARRTKKILIAYLDTFSEVLWSKVHFCEEFAARNGFTSIQFKLHDHSTLDGILAMIRDESSIAGIIFASTINPNSPAFKKVSRLDIPVVMMEPLLMRKIPDNIIVTHPDYLQSGAAMASHLLELGHRHIGYINDIAYPEVIELHRKGIDTALKDNGLSPQNLITVNDRRRPGESVDDSAYRQTELMLKQHPEITGIIYDSGVGAHSGILAVSRQGKSVPNDISVIGEGDYRYTRHSIPPVTVTAYNHRTRAQYAVQAILTGKKNNPLIPVVLIERESTCGISPAA
jgi:DNA-binding LacI/PurR family transcriptional regulator